MQWKKSLCDLRNERENGGVGYDVPDNGPVSGTVENVSEKITFATNNVSINGGRMEDVKKVKKTHTPIKTNPH